VVSVITSYSIRYPAVRLCLGPLRSIASGQWIGGLTVMILNGYFFQ
jgi:hypothetical protein